MPQLYMITVPGLEVRSDWGAVHDRLLDDFPSITDVLATTLASTVLIVYDGRVDVDSWLDSISDAILSRRHRAHRESFAGDGVGQSNPKTTGPHTMKRKSAWLSSPPASSFSSSQSVAGVPRERSRRSPLGAASTSHRRRSVRR